MRSVQTALSPQMIRVIRQQALDNLAASCLRSIHNTGYLFKNLDDSGVQDLTVG